MRYCYTAFRFINSVTSQDSSVTGSGALCMMRYCNPSCPRLPPFSTCGDRGLCRDGHMHVGPRLRRGAGMFPLLRIMIDCAGKDINKTPCISPRLHRPDALRWQDNCTWKICRACVPNRVELFRSEGSKVITIKHERWRLRQFQKISASKKGSHGRFESSSHKQYTTQTYCQHC